MGDFMANYKTGAQRHNDRRDKIWEAYQRQLDKLPPIATYSKFLDQAVVKFRISKDEAREKFGHLTTRGWQKLLEI